MKEEHHNVAYLLTMEEEQALIFPMLPYFNKNTLKLSDNLPGLKFFDLISFSLPS
jgi:hypothetical protein